MCVLYVSFGSKVSAGREVLFILRLLLHSAGSGVNRVQVVLSGFSVRLLWFFSCKTFM